MGATCRYTEGMTTAKALHVKTNGETQVVTLPENNSYLALKEMVGGWMDAVTLEDSVVYVHDEGLLIEGMEPNVFATFLTGRVIMGDVVIVGSLNAKGYHDGENHDVPTEIVEMAEMKALAMNTREEYRQKVIAGRDYIMQDPIKVYGQNEKGEWERV